MANYNFINQLRWTYQDRKSKPLLELFENLEIENPLAIIEAKIILNKSLLDVELEGVLVLVQKYEGNILYHFTFIIAISVIDTQLDRISFEWKNGI